MIGFIRGVTVTTLLASTALAQSLVDGSHLRSAPTPVKHAGTVDVRTGRWTPRGLTPRSYGIVFDNTCFFDAGTGYLEYVTTEACEELYDEGEIPSRDNTVWTAASSSLGGSWYGGWPWQAISGIEFSYCTANAGADIELAFWEKLNGDCAGFTPPTGGGQGHWSRTHGTPGGGVHAPTAYFDLSGIGLPGSSSPGASVACWIVGLSNFSFGFESDGEGTFDNDPARDKFAWAMRNNDVPAGGLPHGWLLAGDPAVVAPGRCTYDIPCGTDWTGAACGTGYGAWDGWWANSDGGVAGGCSPGAVASGCYWFGYPTEPFGNFYLRVDAPMIGHHPHVYCTSRTSSLGCTPTLVTWAYPVIHKGQSWPCLVDAGPVPGGSSQGMLIFGKALTATPIQSPYGELCIQGVNRSAVTLGAPGGTPGTCSGEYVFDMQVLVNHATPAQASSGDLLFIQAWYRDLGNPSGANLTNATGVFLVL